MKWTVWGDGKDPLIEDVSEDVAKYYVETNKDREDLYIQDEEGNEFVLEPGSTNVWVLA